MSGLFLIAVVGLWIWLAFKLSRFIGIRIAGGRWVVPLSALLFLVLLPMPVIDEIIGGFQFRALCKRYAVQTIDEQNVRGARVVSVGGRDGWDAPDTVIPVRIQPWIYQDATTQKVLISYHTLHAEGGVLIRTLGISETRSPLLFSRSCAPPNERAFIKAFNVVITN
jgi:hypothetical protein